jgi:hypothetical protein
MFVNQIDDAQFIQQRALHRAELRSTSKGAARERGAREGGVDDDDPRSQSRSSSVALFEDLDLRAQNFTDLICSENTHAQPFMGFISFFLFLLRI